ncbi:MAG: hypothetical protein FJ137_21630 [Deltaproteobacteria bacterium]|nr:hypothetical protein [Deltaproteobacteria bacterium]
MLGSGASALAASGEGGGEEGEGEGEEGKAKGEGEGELPCFACDDAGVRGDGACLLPPGSEFTGTCGPCATSLDCCFPSTSYVATAACVLLEG